MGYRTDKNTLTQADAGDDYTLRSILACGKNGAMPRRAQCLALLSLSKHKLVTICLLRSILKPNYLWLRQSDLFWQDKLNCIKFDLHTNLWNCHVTVYDANCNGVAVLITVGTTNHIGWPVFITRLP